MHTSQKLVVLRCVRCRTPMETDLGLRPRSAGGGRGERTSDTKATGVVDGARTRTAGLGGRHAVHYITTTWSREMDSNHRSSPYEGAALTG